MAFPGASARLAAALVLSLALIPAHALAAPADVAREYVERNRRAFGLTGADVDEITVSSIVPSAHNGVTHVYLQQEFRGIEVHNALFTVSVRKDAVLGASGRFVANVAAQAAGQSARKAAADAARTAARELGLTPRGELRSIARRGGPEDATTLTDGGISARPIEAQLAWLPMGSALRLAWQVEIEEVDGEHHWLVFVDAESGALLAREDLVVHDDSVATGEAIARPADAPAPGLSFDDIDGSSYRVFALPLESPLDGDRTLVSGAADPAASPFGWHDTNGSPGAEFTVTRGNNVHAYTDVDANGIPDPGSDPDGGAGLDFDFALDLTLAPPTYRPAAVTNLFYWNNVVHDVTAGYGFDEAAGNFQVTNYSGAVGGGDDVRAEAQDGSGTNNANFSTPAQNHPTQPRPRMQMYVWNDPRGNKVTVASGPAAGDHEASGAAFGPPLTTTGPITGEVALVNDGVIGVPVPPATVPGTLDDGCEPFGGVSGKIALLQRGFCPFVQKVGNAQAAGAIAVIVGNNAPGLPVTLGGADPTITIPSVMVSLPNYNLFKDSVPFTATLRNAPRTPRDSDLDAGVIAHEYGHGISNRLTGGPNVVTCLQNAEQMGEGWSDFYALVMTTHPSDTRVTARGIGPYVNFEAADGFGIRPTQYTTDMAINPSTYASVANTAITQPHGIGYVWNTMLWEMYWNLADRYGYNADIYAPWDEGGNNLAIQLVTDGMKIQPCSPGFVDGRNAILAGDSALTGGENQCEIWRAFAKRGLGFSASQGLSTNRFDGVPAFDLPASCTTAVFGGFRPPVQAPPAINVVDAGDVVPVKFSLSGDTATLSDLDSQEVDCTSLVPTGEAPSPLATAGNTGLKQKGDEYHVNWLTDAAWAGTCRRLTLRIAAPSDAVAYFRFE